MNTQELIQEAAVIRDERNQYANTAERVGTALVHMAEQLAAQASDVDKIEKDVRGTLTLAQLDNPLGFTTNVQWAQGLNEDKTYTFRLVDTSGRCIGHVWLLNDADYWDSPKAARLIEVVMCCATINAEGVLTTEARSGSPRIYYRTYCTPLSGGTPDGGFPSGIFKWSAWQEYRDYVANPIKDALAALQQQHATDVAELQANIDAVDLREGTPTATSVPLVLTKAIKDTVTCNLGPATTARAGVMTASDKGKLDGMPGAFVLDLGQVSSIDVGDALAAKSEIAGNRNIFAIRYTTKGASALRTTVIIQWCNGINESAQIKFTDKSQWRRNVTGATGVAGAPTNAFQWERTGAHYLGYDAATRKLQLKDYNQTAFKDVQLPLATSSAAGLMSSEDKVALETLSNMWLQIDEEFSDPEDIPAYFQNHPNIALNETYKFFQCRISNEDFTCNVWGMKSVRFTTDNMGYAGIYFMYGECHEVEEVAFYRQDEQSAWEPDEIANYSPINSININEKGGNIGLVSYRTSGLHEFNSTHIFPNASTTGPGMMTAAHVQKLANLEARIAALEAKSK